jgi:uncharacterized delta-60 repeat protein
MTNARIARQTLCWLVFLLALGASGNDARGQDGFLDASWADGGRELVDVTAGADNGSSVLGLPDGKLLVAGTCYVPLRPIVTFCAARLQGDGTYDTSFGPRQLGYVEFDEFPGFSTDQEFSLSTVVRAPDGRYLFVGRRDNSAMLALLGSDGQAIDATWVSDFSSAVATGAAYQADGKIIVAGTARGSTGNLDFLVMRFESSLSLDTAFGNGGFAYIAFDLGGPSGDDTDLAQGLVLQPDGRITVYGEAFRSSDGTESDIVIGQLLPSGELDTSFGNGAGRVDLDLAASETATAAAFDSTGRVVIGGYISQSGNPQQLDRDAIVVRLLQDGSLDQSFAGIGWKMACCDSGSPTNDSINAVLTQSDGAIVFAGTTETTSASAVSIGRIEANGDADLSFGLGGVNSFGFADSSHGDFATSACLCNGGLMVLGTAQDALGEYFFGLAKVSVDLIFRDSFD